jgi:hypothetical protein
MSMKLVVLFGSFTLLCAWSLTSLLCFHGMIISAAQTTNERVRGVYRFGSNAGNGTVGAGGAATTLNAADQGCCHNWYQAFCSPWVASRLPNDMADTVICHYATMKEEMVWNGDAPYTPIEQSAAPASHGGEALPMTMSSPMEDTTTATSGTAIPTTTTEQQGLDHHHVPRTESETDLV